MLTARLVIATPALNTDFQTLSVIRTSSRVLFLRAVARIRLQPNYFVFLSSSAVPSRPRDGILSPVTWTACAAFFMQHEL
jgi:hypothetical protein